MIHEIDKDSDVCPLCKNPYLEKTTAVVNGIQMYKCNWCYGIMGCKEPVILKPKTS
jgi:transposase-like protein